MLNAELPYRGGTGPLNLLIDGTGHKAEGEGALWRRWSGYHRGHRIKIKVHCMKLMGQSLMARDVERLLAEIQIRIAVLNRYTAVGIPPSPSP